MKGASTTVQILFEGASYLKAKIDAAQAELAAREAAEKKRTLELSQSIDSTMKLSDIQTAAIRDFSLNSMMSDNSTRPLDYKLSSNVNSTSTNINSDEEYSEF
jgi:hypothetical protein